MQEQRLQLYVWMFDKVKINLIFRCGLKLFKQAVNGYATMNVQVGRLTAKHGFYVIRNLNRNIILGRNWLQVNGECIYYDLEALLIKDT